MNEFKNRFVISETVNWLATKHFLKHLQTCIIYVIYVCIAFILNAIAYVLPVIRTLNRNLK